MLYEKERIDGPISGLCERWWVYSFFLVGFLHTYFIHPQLHLKNCKSAGIKLNSSVIMHYYVLAWLNGCVMCEEFFVCLYMAMDCITFRGAYIIQEAKLLSSSTHHLTSLYTGALCICITIAYLIMDGWGKRRGERYDMKDWCGCADFLIFSTSTAVTVLFRRYTLSVFITGTILLSSTISPLSVYGGYIFYERKYILKRNFERVFLSVHVHA